LRFALTAGFLLAISATAQAQDILVGRAGPEGASSVLRRELAMPHLVIPPDTAAADLPADSVYPRGVLVLGRDATVNGTVHGDVTVIGGDLYLHPGAHIDGRAVAIGGAVYNSSLATVGGAQESYRDFTYAITQLSEGYMLDYESLIVEHRGLSLPAWVGLSAPGYDRTDGLSVPISVNVGSGTGRLALQPVVTYRSELGRLDPQLSATLQLGANSQLLASAGRTTLTNDRWIRSDLANSVESFLLGNDVRNYYRANFVDARVTRLWSAVDGTFQPYLGARIERDVSVRPALFATGGPWSLIGRHDSSRMLRPNPQVPSGDLAAASVGATLTWNAGGVATTATVDEELSHFAPAAGAGVAAATIALTTLDARVQFATFGLQSFSEHVHALATGGGATPLERFAYLGGPGTISTLDMLSMGGDELLFLDSRYQIPVTRIQFPFLGAPALILRHVIGAAGVRRLPALEQAVGVRVALNALYGEVMVDPATRHAHFGAGISLGH
jgi:hypothetical protein